MTRGISGLILAGGAGRRLGGQDKGFAMLAGRPLVAHVLARFAPQVGDLAISANRNLDAYGALGHPVLSDDVADAGPLAGIALGLEHAREPLLAVVPCDCPFLPRDLVARLAAAFEREGAEIACAALGGRLQSVCVLIDRALAPSVREYLARGERKVERWIASHRLAVVDYPADCPGFANMNAPGDLAAAAARTTIVAGRASPPVIGLAAASGTGKTALLRALLPRFKDRGLAVGVIKHTHHDIEMDHPGKDSYEIRHAGAGQVMLASRHRWTLIGEQEHEPEPAALVARLALEELDLVLVEGFKHARMPKIELHRAALGAPLLCREDDSIIAVASDALLVPPRGLPLLDLNDPSAIAHFILSRHFPIPNE